jgi:hypothetical protein
MLAGNLFMKKFWHFLFFILFSLLGACTTNTDATPTPFPTGSAAITEETNALLESVSLAELAANPEQYVGRFLAVNGRFHPIIPVICSTTQYKSPATWGLTQGEFEISMRGYDQQLRSLLPKETNMAVSGTWRQWRGPVGCGKAAEFKDIWYLDVQKIDSPNPLTQITLTPTIPGDENESDEEVAAINLTPTDPMQIEATMTPDSGEGLSTSTPDSAAQPGSAPATSTPTSALAANPTRVIPTATTQPTQTTAPTSSPGGDTRETAVPTNTPAPTATSNGSSRPTATPGSNNNGSQGTPQPTPNQLPTSTPVPSEVAKGELFSFEVMHENIQSEEIHEWTFELFSNDTLTVTVAGDPNTDFVISIIDESDNAIIDQQNNGASDELEIAVVNSADAGIYSIQVATVDSASGYYAIAGIDGDSISSLPTAYKGILEDGDSLRSTVEIDYEDYWFFYAEAGDSVTITVEPFDINADMIIYLYNDKVDGSGPIIDVDSPTLGATEALVDFVIPQDGVYMIATSEFDFNEVDYEITLSID